MCIRDSYKLNHQLREVQEAADSSNLETLANHLVTDAAHPCRFCGPFIGKFYSLVVQDSFSKFPEVFLTTSASSDFTKMALRRFFAREGVPQVIVTDNGTHLTRMVQTDRLLSTLLPTKTPLLQRRGREYGQALEDSNSHGRSAEL